MSSLSRSSLRPGAGFGLLGWSLLTFACLFLGLLVPGLGLVLAVIVALTALRGNRRAQAICLAVGLLSLVLVLVRIYGLQAGGGHGVVSHPTPASG